MSHHQQLSQVRSVADLDPLTEIYHKGALSQRLEQALLEADTVDGELSVFLFDLDHFKGRTHTSDGARGFGFRWLRLSSSRSFIK